MRLSQPWYPSACSVYFSYTQQGSIYTWAILLGIFLKRKQIIPTLFPQTALRLYMCCFYPQHSWSVSSRRANKENRSLQVNFLVSCKHRTHSGAINTSLTKQGEKGNERLATTVSLSNCPPDHQLVYKELYRVMSLVLCTKWHFGISPLLAGDQHTQRLCDIKLYHTFIHFIWNWWISRITPLNSTGRLAAEAKMADK